MVKISTLKSAAVLAVFATSFAASSAQAGVSITKDANCKTYGAGDKHAVATLFFGANSKNIVATNNEYLEQDGLPYASKPTNIRFDVFLANGSKAGECLGGINVKIDPNTNESAQFAIEDYIKKVSGDRIGLITRTGSTGVQKKFDIFVDVMADGKRSTIWNNFIGLPNKSAEMSPMRFYSGHHLLINYSGSDAGGADASIQVFSNDGKFVGVTKVNVGPKSVLVTDSVRTLSYTDASGKAIAADNLPKDGMGYIKVTGVNDKEAQRATGNLYKAVAPNSMDGAKFTHADLARATITWSRRNAGLGKLKVGQ